jgi:hypothetical protein
MNRKKLAFATACALVLLSGCATLATGAVSPSAPGFWTGLLHGFLFFLAFLTRIFSDTVAIYDTPNNGRLYDLGYVLGIALWFAVMGGGTAHATKNNDVEKSNAS